MKMAVKSIDVRLSLTEQGDALLYGLDASGDFVPGMRLKQLLFAWHEASYYGTVLELRHVRGIEIVVLPAEQVIPFFAEPPLLAHMEWKWGGEAALLIRLAPGLNTCVAEKRYVPSRDACSAGRLQWAWEAESVDRLIASFRAAGEADEDFAGRLRAAFSAAVFDRHYDTEERAADLRRQYPLLFEQGAVETARLMRDEEWLIHIGWRPDTVPFRPALQLLEPGEDDTAWRLRFVLQDKEQPASIVPVRIEADGAMRGDWPPEWTDAVRERTADWFSRLKAALPDAVPEDGLDSGGAPLDDEAAWRFLTADSQRLLLSGWQVLLPVWWEEARRKRPKLRASVRTSAAGPGPALFGLDAIVNFDWRIALGGVELSEREFLELAAGGRRLIQLQGEWIPLDPAMLRRIRRAMAQYDPSRGMTFRDVLHLHLLGADSGTDHPADGDETDRTDGDGGPDDRIVPGLELDAHLFRLIRQLGRPEERPLLPPPDGLRTALRPYQQAGFSWLAFLRRFGLGACLADDMGLGKTVQLIAYLLHARKEQRAAGTAMPSLIVCPTSIIGNWQKELRRFAPTLKVLLHYGSGRSSGDDFRAAAAAADVVLTSYTTAALDQASLAAVEWDAVCLDEAQNIKNASTKQSAAVRRFPARHRIALTGTPIENRLSELWSIYDFMNPGYFGSLRAFQERFASAAGRTQEKAAGSSPEQGRDDARMTELRKLVQPFMLRRRKKDPAVQLDLPEKNEMKTYVPLTAEQAALYDRTVRELLERSGSLDGMKRKGAILAALTRLKQLCAHPALVTKEPLPTVHAAAGEGAPAARSGERAEVEALAARSAKLQRLIEMVEELREAGERCLIFTQYVGMGRMLQHVLRTTLGEPVLYLHGGTPRTMRDRMIESFQAERPARGPQPHVFVLSLKAGGVGLNLTAASHVFHYDRWWNPAVENQATDRAYRIGQTRDVQVYKFIALGTLEERIDEMLESKQRLSDTVMAGSEDWITELSTEALRELVMLRQDLVR